MSVKEPVEAIEAAIEFAKSEHSHNRWECDDCDALWYFGYEEGRDDEFRKQQMNKDNEP